MKYTLLLLLLCGCSCHKPVTKSVPPPAPLHQDEHPLPNHPFNLGTIKMSNSNTTTTISFGLGNLAGALASWVTNHSILWMILHFFFGWFYVIYWFFFHYLRNQ